MKNTFLVLVILTLLSSCYFAGDENYDIIEETAVEVVDEDDDTDEIIIIQEVRSMELQPIKEYEGYVKQGNRVFGIDGDQLEEIVLMDTEGNNQPLEKFFVKDGMIYMSVEVREQGDAIPDTDPVQYEAVLKEYFFEQENGDLQIVQSIPDLPPSERVQFSDTVFQINNETYKDLEVSNVLQMPAVMAFKIINGCLRVSNGLWFSVTESYSSRLKGVYFWAVNTGGPKRVKTEGRIW